MNQRAAPIILLILLVTVVIAIASMIRVFTLPPVQPGDPALPANLTALAVAPPLSGEAAENVNALAGLVAACPDYTPERRAQMEQHLAWLLNPASIPPELRFAFASNPPERLLFGMATYTGIEWGQRGRAPDSCLRAIGERINGLLVEAGGEPYPAFVQS
jgi:hypothetical protein